MDIQREAKPAKNQEGELCLPAIAPLGNPLSQAVFAAPFDAAYDLRELQSKIRDLASSVEASRPLILATELHPKSSLAGYLMQNGIKVFFCEGMDLLMGEAADALRARTNPSLVYDHENRMLVMEKGIFAAVNSDRQTAYNLILWAEANKLGDIRAADIGRTIQISLLKIRRWNNTGQANPLTPTEFCLGLDISRKDGEAPGSRSVYVPSEELLIAERISDNKSITERLVNEGLTNTAKSGLGAELLHKAQEVQDRLGLLRPPNVVVQEYAAHPISYDRVRRTLTVDLSMLTLSREDFSAVLLFGLERMHRTDLYYSENRELAGAKAVWQMGRALLMDQKRRQNLEAIFGTLMGSGFDTVPQMEFLASLACNDTHRLKGSHYRKEREVKNRLLQCEVGKPSPFNRLVSCMEGGGNLPAIFNEPVLPRTCDVLLLQSYHPNVSAGSAGKFLAGQRGLLGIISSEVDQVEPHKSSYELALAVTTWGELQKLASLKDFTPAPKRERFHIRKGKGKPPKELPERARRPDSELLHMAKGAGLSDFAREHISGSEPALYLQAIFGSVRAQALLACDKGEFRRGFADLFNKRRMVQGLPSGSDKEPLPESPVHDGISLLTSHHPYARDYLILALSCVLDCLREGGSRDRFPEASHYLGEGLKAVLPFWSFGLDYTRPQVKSLASEVNLLAPGELGAALSPAWDRTEELVNAKILSPEAARIVYQDILVLAVHLGKVQEPEIIKRCARITGEGIASLANTDLTSPANDLLLERLAVKYLLMGQATPYLEEIAGKFFDELPVNLPLSSAQVSYLKPLIPYIRDTAHFEKLVRVSLLRGCAYRQPGVDRNEIELIESLPEQPRHAALQVVLQDRNDYEHVMARAGPELKEFVLESIRNTHLNAHLAGRGIDEIRHHLAGLSPGQISSAVSALERTGLKRDVVHREVYSCAWQGPLTVQDLLHGETLDNYYAILGVPREASPEEVKKSYRRLSHLFHPDRLSSESPEAQNEALERFKLIQNSYEVLSDPVKRREFTRRIPNVRANYPSRPWFAGLEELELA